MNNGPAIISMLITALNRNVALSARRLAATADLISLSRGPKSQFRKTPNKPALFFEGSNPLRPSGLGFGSAAGAEDLGRSRGGGASGPPATFATQAGGAGSAGAATAAGAVAGVSAAAAIGAAGEGSTCGAIAANGFNPSGSGGKAANSVTSTSRIKRLRRSSSLPTGVTVIPGPGFCSSSSRRRMAASMRSRSSCFLSFLRVT